MKILFLALGVYQVEGGIERFNQRVIRVLGDQFSKQNLENVFILSLWDSPRIHPSGEGIQFIGEDSYKFKMIYDFLKIILFEKPDKIILGHILFLPMALLVRILSRKTKILLIVHGIEVTGKPSTLDIWLTQHCIDLFLSVSEYTASQIAANYQVPRERVTILGNAIDPIAPPENIHATHPSQKPVLVSISRLTTQSRHKNIDKVIQTLPTILESFPGTQYFIIGDGDLRRELESMVTELHLENFVHFLGSLDDAGKNSILEKSDIFILPSVGEGFGIVFLEAWQFYLPIITSNQGAAPEIIEDGKGGLCVEPNPFAISQAVIQLLIDPEMRMKMGRFGFTKLQNNYLHHNFQEKLSEYLCRS